MFISNWNWDERNTNLNKLCQITIHLKIKFNNITTHTTNVVVEEEEEEEEEEETKIKMKEILLKNQGLAMLHLIKIQDDISTCLCT